MGIVLDELHVNDDPEAWRKAGFSVDDSGVCRIGHVAVHISPTPAEKGITAWGLRGIKAKEIDGLETFAPDSPPSEPASHPNGSTLIDHIVVWTPDNPRTTQALQEAGLDLRRTREAREYDKPMQQTFFRPGEVIIEVIGPPEADGDEPAQFFGLAHSVADLPATGDTLGEHMGRIKDAVQPGRQIASLRHKDLGMSVPTVFMSAQV